MNITKVELENLAHSRRPLSDLVKDTKPYTKEHVQDLFGSVGADIFEKRKVSIVDKSKLSAKYPIINKFMQIFAVPTQTEFEQLDTPYMACLKYICNHESGLYEDFKNKFGKVGQRVFYGLGLLGMVEENSSPGQVASK